MIKLKSLMEYYIHRTKNIKQIKKYGLKPYNGVFGKAIYLTKPEYDIHSYGKTIPLKVELSNIKLNKDYNHKNAYEDLMKLKDEVGDLQKYFLSKGFDGLDLTKFIHEPQIILYNEKKIKNIGIAK